MEMTAVQLNPDLLESAIDNLRQHVRGYCFEGAGRVETFHPKYRPGEVERFSRMATRLLDEMDALVGTARKVSALDHLDFDAMERDFAELRALVGRVGLRELAIQN